MTAKLDVTLTLAEYMRRMTSADASEWLPTPSETVVLDRNGVRILRFGKYAPLCGGYPAMRSDKDFGFYWPYEPVTVSLLTY